MAHESRQVPPTPTPATTLLPVKIIMQRTRNPERALSLMPWGAGAASLAEKWILDVLCVQLAGPQGRQWGQGGGDCPHQLLTPLPDALLQSLDAQGWRLLSHVSYTWWGQNLETELFVIGRHGGGGVSLLKAGGGLKKRKLQKKSRLQICKLFYLDISVHVHICTHWHKQIPVCNCVPAHRCMCTHAYEHDSAHTHTWTCVNDHAHPATHVHVCAHLLPQVNKCTPTNTQRCI